MPVSETLADENASRTVADDDNVLDSLTREISRHHAQAASVHSLREILCCCGRSDCAFLRRSQNMLAELEKDVQTAAKLGQALLERHERSMREAQHELNKMASKVTSLESKATTLKDENSKTINENKSLLASLDDVNKNMLASDMRARDLQEELDVTHAKLTRVSAAASRTEILEAQLTVLESEQQELRSVVTATQEEERIAVVRWKTAERSLADLNAQIEKIEHEHVVEKARSLNMLERLQQQRRYSTQKTGESYPTALAERTALARFMKEILAENGHLQRSVAELRKMLMASQEEADVLREQVQGFTYGNIEHFKSPLSIELSRSPSRTSASTVVHHHHYHQISANDKAASRPQTRKQRKRRHITAEHLGGRHTLGIKSLSPPEARIFAQQQRWRQSKLSSMGATSSLPTSPSSTFQDPSIFDRSFNTETSRPTSVDSKYQSSCLFTYAKIFSPPTLAVSSSISSQFDLAQEKPASLTVSAPFTPERRLLQRSLSHESLLNPFAMAANPMPSSIISRALPHSTNGPSASITPGIAIRSPNNTQGSSAYSRLLGLQQDSVSSMSTSRSTSTSKNSRWLWGWGKGGHNTPVAVKKVANKSGVMPTYVDEELLRASLTDGRGIFTENTII